MLSELLSFTNPIAFSGGLRIRSMVMQVAGALGVDTIWQLEVATLMSQISCVTLPVEILNKLYADV